MKISLNMTQTAGKIELVIFFAVYTMCHAIEIRVPVNYTALTGDLEIHVQDLTPQEDPYYLQLLEYYPLDNSFTIISSTPLSLDNATTLVYKAKFPCGVIAQGGRYGVRIQSDYNSDINEILVTVPDNAEVAARNGSDVGRAIEERMKDFIVQLDVRWPMVVLSIEPQEIETYPDVNITASVMFQASYCEPAIGSLVPETWISLIYCGHSPIECKLDNVSHLSQILYSEQIRGYPRLRDINLRCQLFGQAGYYTLYLTSGMHATGSVVATVPTNGILKAKWSEKFVFNVHTRSIFQCDAHNGGVAVLFQYPNCILPNDKIRLFGSLRADVASLSPPTTLHYITEQRVIKGKYSLHFDCDLFSEKYVEYCFVYVNQAITGAVSDVRMDCVPTYPVNEAGQWGSWSEWSECSSTCKGGTRNRYRFCDSPSPKYGAKYCEGHTVETQVCGNSTSWECQLYDVQVTPELLAEKPEIQEVVGEKCRCGCIIHLDTTMPQRFLAASMRNCSKKAWWKIQADSDHTIQLYMNRVHFPCATQKLKIHDGEFLSSNLLAQFTSTDIVTMTNFSVMSSASVLLLEYSISENLNNVDCAGGFLCHFRQKAGVASNISHVYAQSISGEMPVEAVHVAILVMLIIVVSMSLCMMVQYVDRYHKYQRAAVNDDITDTECSETFSRRNFAAVISHETSTSTLISEIIPLKKLRKGNKSLQTNDCVADFESSSQSENEDSGVNMKLVQKNMSPSSENKELGSKIRVFKAEVHVENKPEELNGSIKSASVTDDISPDPVVGLNSSRTTISDRRPSVCTRISISSSISPTLSAHTNVISSPNSSIRGSTLKRVKDIKNQEKMLVGSDFSLTGQDIDLEMDYYDYNVHNTSAVPGSYLGMDPAYCVWIPPFAPGQWIDNGSDDDDSSSTNDIEMKVISRRCSRKFSETSDSESRSETPTEKFQRECKRHPKEKFKRFSGVSTASSSNRTIVPEEMTPDDDLTIQQALRPDSPPQIQHAVVIKDGDSEVKALLDKEDIKFVDDDDSDTAYNSDDDEMKKLKKSTNKHIKSMLVANGKEMKH